MKIKDIVKVALFAVISFILFMVGSALGGLFGVYGMYMSHAISAFLSIPVYMIMCRQIKKRGITFLYFAIFGIVYTVMGFWPMLPVCLIAGLISELILISRDSFEKPVQIGLAGVVGYVIYSLHGLFFLLVFGVQGLVAQFPTMFNLEGAQQLADFFLNPITLGIVVLILIVTSSCGAWIGNFLFNKFFSKKVRTEKEIFS